MSEEKFNPQEADVMTNLITNRLAERQRILNRMKSMEKGSSRTIKFGGAIALAVAACIVAIFVFQPFASVSPLEEAGIEQPSMSNYRGASEDISEIENLMKKPDYAAALIRTQKSLAHLELQIDQFDDLPVEYEEEDEGILYEAQNDKLMASELRWTYIYLLTKQNHTKEAIKQLKIYIKDKEFAEHMDEAKRLLDVLKKKS